MNTSPLELAHVSKAFGNTHAVQDLSFTVNKGEIFGLLGPNGAGKTTAIRIALGLLTADGGEISILHGPMTEAKKHRIGYMPEERGLYQDLTLQNCLTYLARLKGMHSLEIRKRLDTWLEQFELEEYRKKKVKELSKGMQQKAQIISTFIHQPELVIVDEPFSGLDPVNTNMVKVLLGDLRQQGVTILMSTHQMHLVEELCNRILLINHGSGILYGELAEIQRSFSGHAILLRTPGEIPPIEGVKTIEQHNLSYLLSLEESAQPQSVLKRLLDAGVQVEGYEIAVPSLDEIFIQAVKGSEDG
jgi:ABC-2 type transport system ATP-binding protein